MANIPKRQFTRSFKNVAHSTTILKRMNTRGQSDSDLARMVMFAIEKSVFGGGEQRKPTRTAYDPPKSCTVAGDTVLLSVPVLLKFASKINEKASYFSTIPKLDIKCYVAVSGTVSQQLQSKVCDLTQILESIASLCKGFLDANNVEGEEFDEMLFKVIQLFMTTLKEAIQSTQDPGILKQPIFQLDGYKKIISKFAVTHSQTSDLVTNLSGRIKAAFNVNQLQWEEIKHEIRLQFHEGCVFLDLKAHLDDLSRDICRGYKESDFQSPQGYRIYKEAQTKHLGGLLNVFTTAYPDAVRRAMNARPGLALPEDIKSAERYYSKVLTLLLVDDMRTVSQGLPELSKTSKAILNECALRWKISNEYRSIAFVHALLERFEAGELDPREFGVPLRSLFKIDLNLIRKSDYEYLWSAFQKLDTCIFKQIGELLATAHRKSTVPEEANSLAVECCQMLLELRENLLWQKKGGNQSHKCKEDIISCIESSAIKRFNLVSQKLDEIFDESQQFVRLSKLVSSINGFLKKYQNYFKDVIFDKYLVAQIAGKAFIKASRADILNIGNIGHDIPLTDVFSLYEGVNNFYTMCEEELGIQDSRKGIEIEALFAPFVEKWLSQTNDEWMEWVDRTYQADKDNKFPPENMPSDMTSISVTQVFKELDIGLDFMKRFNFTDNVKKDKLNKNLIKAISKTLERYSDLIFGDFRDLSTIDPSFIFTQEYVIRMNNVLASQSYLEKMMNQLAEATDGGDFKHASRIEDPGKYSFSIYIISGNEIPGKDLIWNTSDCYVSLSIGKQLLGNSRPIKNTVSPVWNEQCPPITIDRKIDGPDAFLYFNAFHQSEYGNDVEIGKTQLYLRGHDLSDCLSHYRELELDTEGKICIRVRRLGEIDDTTWYVRRADEVLQNTTSDMIRTFVYHISRAVDAAIKDIVEKSGESRVMGFVVKKATDITNDVVEEGLLKAFEFLDKNLSQFNLYIDRRFDEYLYKLYPMLSKKTRSLKNKERLMDEEGSLNIQRTPILILVVWYEILVTFLTSINGFENRQQQQTTLSDHEKRHIQVLDYAVEFFKTLFFCQQDGRCQGLSLPELENKLYIQVREKLDKFINPE